MRQWQKSGVLASFSAIGVTTVVENILGDEEGWSCVVNMSLQFCMVISGCIWQTEMVVPIFKKRVCFNYGESHSPTSWEKSM